MSILKVISGGQDGADIAGLRAAKDYGIETGGFMPLNYETASGSRPEYKDLYNMHEVPYEGAKGYRFRTLLNIEHSNGTVLFAHTWDSPGTKFTLHLLKHHGKPFMIVHCMRSGAELSCPPTITAWKGFLSRNNVQVLNIAGNRDPDLEEPVYKYLVKIFIALKKAK